MKKITSKSAARKLMELENSIWEKLDIESGSDLIFDKETQKKYIASLKKADVILLSSEDVQKTYDILEDENYSMILQYFVFRGYFGEKIRNRYKQYYESSMSMLDFNDIPLIENPMIYKVEYKLSNKKTLTKFYTNNEDLLNDLDEMDKEIKNFEVTEI